MVILARVSSPRHAVSRSLRQEARGTRDGERIFTEHTGFRRCALHAYLYELRRNRWTRTRRAPAAVVNAREHSPIIQDIYGFFQEPFGATLARSSVLKVYSLARLSRPNTRNNSVQWFFSYNFSSRCTVVTLFFLIILYNKCNCYYLYILSALRLLVRNKVVLITFKFLRQ